MVRDYSRIDGKRKGESVAEDFSPRKGEREPKRVRLRAFGYGLWRRRMSTDMRDTQQTMISKGLGKALSVQIRVP